MYIETDGIPKWHNVFSLSQKTMSANLVTLQRKDRVRQYYLMDEPLLLPQPTVEPQACTSTLASCLLLLDYLECDFLGTWTVSYEYRQHLAQ